ncbi:MAG: 50S ribosomal protein L25 [Candidatus Vogelbacteria bacterium]|nr:50S ribosomal protein L25 [Candidatus Vogelbacteria bacterium]
MLELKARKREILGKRVRSIRSAGDLPVVVYGAGESALPLTVNSQEFVTVWKKAGESSVIKLDTDAGKKDVLVQDVSFHAVTGQPLHADFYLVKADQLIKVYIPIRFEGVAPAVKTFSGVMVKVLHEVEVEALPADLPHELVADVSGLEKLEDRVFVKNIKLPNGVTIVGSQDGVVALVSVGKDEVEEVAPPDLTAIEVEKKGKKPEEGEDAEASADGDKAPAPKK